MLFLISLSRSRPLPEPQEAAKTDHTKNRAPTQETNYARETADDPSQAPGDHADEHPPVSSRCVRTQSGNLQKTADRASSDKEQEHPPFSCTNPEFIKEHDGQEGDADANHCSPHPTKRQIEHAPNHNLLRQSHRCTEAKANDEIRFFGIHEVYDQIGKDDRREHPHNPPDDGRYDPPHPKTPTGTRHFCVHSAPPVKSHSRLGFFALKADSSLPRIRRRADQLPDHPQ